MLTSFAFALSVLATPGAPQGYHRFAALFEDVVVFTSEGDLWRVPSSGGRATRLTTHPGEETHASISLDGTTIAFTAEYEGPLEVYTMPIEGGLPIRRTFHADSSIVVGWSSPSEVLYRTRRFSTLPSWQLAQIDTKTGVSGLLPLAQAYEGVFDPTNKTVFFTRFPFQGSATKRYVGGTAQNLWKFSEGSREAAPLTADYPGTSKNPMFWNDRVFFLSDASGVVNIWSMKTDGTDRTQVTRHSTTDVMEASLSKGRIVYRLGADLHLLDLRTLKSNKLRIDMPSDFDQRRERWVKNPIRYLTSAWPSPNGDRVVFTARGQVFVAPAKQGRFVRVTTDGKARHRNARFIDDKRLLVQSDRTGELEYWIYPADGIGTPTQITHSSGPGFRYGAVPSPNGRWIAHVDKDFALWLIDVETKKTKLVTRSEYDAPTDLTWSPDSRWLAYVSAASNWFGRIHLHQVDNGRDIAVTSERVESRNPAFSPDGRWLYFLSDRTFQSLTRSPWGARQPDPFLDKPTKIYSMALGKDRRSPFRPNDELVESDEKGSSKDKDADKSGKVASKKVELQIDLDGIASRVYEVPIPSGNHRHLSVADKTLFWLETETSLEGKKSLRALEIGNEDVKAKTVLADVKEYDLSADNKKLLVLKGSDAYVIDASAKAPDKLSKSKIDRSKWTFPVDPKQEWRQMFIEAWRLERDYFYDKKMHSVDWKGVLDRYLPLVDRVSDRAELSDLISQMVAELSALHIFVRGGDQREGADRIWPGLLGADLVRSDVEGGYRIEKIYRGEDDDLDLVSPLIRPDLDIREGDFIIAIDGRPTLAEHPARTLRNRAKQQVRLEVRRAGSRKPKSIIIEPLEERQASDLRYRDWERTRRLRVEEAGGGEIGYVHLRAMGGSNFSEWVKGYYPVFHRKGLIIDVRHNRGGNIDSWILGKLLRKAWFYWQGRAGRPYWNMQYAFRGHMVVLCNERTASDGEAFAEGFRRLGLGKVIGTRTWGGEIWLSFENYLVDRGIASAAEYGVYGPEGEWLIEGHGVEPDIVVDNPPHAVFNGRDPQLDRAIEHLKAAIAKQPVEVTPPPVHPDKSIRTWKKPAWVR